MAGQFLEIPKLNRKKSLSLPELPFQNNNFLCVPSEANLFQLKKTRSTENIFNKKSSESLRRITSTTSITIPENFTFSSVEIQVYKRRWILLVLCVLYTAVSYMQWIQFSIIANVVMKYYNVTSVMVDWTSMIFMVTYIVLVFPVSYFMDVKGLRQTAIIGAIGTCLGAWIKIFALGRDLFLIAFFGQTISAIAQVFVCNVPSRLATIWFSPNQMSSVCGVGVFGAQLGTALGFFLTPLIVRNNENLDTIHSELEILFYYSAVLSTIVALLVVGMFESSPQCPPSHVQAIQRCVRASKKGFWKSINNLLTDKNFMTLVVAYGINVGVFNGFSTLLNQIVLDYFPDGEQDAGNIGLGLIVTGLFGSIVFGYIIDDTQKFKETAVWVSGLTTCGMFLFCLALESGSKTLLYVASIALGFFMTGFQPVGFEFASELTFPIAEGPTAGIMNISTHIFGIAITLLISKVQNWFGNFIGNLGFSMLLISCTIVTNFIKPDLKRKFAHEEVATVAEEIAGYEKEAFLQFKIDQYD